MQLINAQTNSETVTIGGDSYIVPPGGVWDSSQAITVRGTTYSDGSTNTTQLIVGPSSVSVLHSPGFESYLQSGFDVGIAVGGTVLAIAAIMAGLKAGIERGL